MVNEFVYCPRLFYYEWIDGLFAHSVDTVEGANRHAAIDSSPTEMPPPDQDALVVSRSVQLSSETHRLIAKIDVVESASGEVSPVEYKKGSPCDGPDGPAAWPADRVQAGVQALVLMDNGYTCSEAVLYYSATRQRVSVRVDEALIGETVAAVQAARALAAHAVRPEPLVDSPKCPRCSLVGICLPDETRLWSLLDEESDHQLVLFEKESVTDEQAPAKEPRRLVPARDDLRPLYVVGYDMIVGKNGEVLTVKQKGKLIDEIRLHELSQVNLYGNVQITAHAVQVLCEAERPVAHFSYGGWFYGLTQGLGLKNVFLRRDQFQLASVPLFCVAIARRIVHNKIRNQRRLLQRNHVSPSPLMLQQLNRYADAAMRAADLPTLLGIEGTAARLYFSAFTGMLKIDKPGEEKSASGPFKFDVNGRNRRPPRDPVNALLSFGYSLLAKDLTIICAAVGFDPFIGFYHQPRFGRPALALDIMEAFRPLIVDSAVITAINTRMIGADDFLQVGPAVAMKPKARKAFLRAYEQRMDTLVTHPHFRYRVNYRRVLEIQTRLLARVIAGEISHYPGFETR
ncbi:MAG TPA: CRISPR-associated endonuclease Cas1 [Candidatus Binatia bacterium]|nr:CRISPR-associated endonuclease Cas1 [Candidatus Binatia bacterium]